MLLLVFKIEVIIMKCFVCGEKISLMNDKGLTKDRMFICYKDINKLFDITSAKKYLVPTDVKKKINQMTSTAILNVLQENLQGKLFCPNCGSQSIQPLERHKKSFSVGKAAAGAALAGGPGVLAGFIGSDTKQTDFVCMDCGTQFRK